MPGTLDRLLNAAGTRRFEHTVAQLREERASAEAEAQAAQRFSEHGFAVLPQRPESWDDACIPLRFLVTADRSGADEQAVTDPAHWAVLLYEDTALRDVETGELVDEDTASTGIPRTSPTPRPKKVRGTPPPSPRQQCSCPNTSASTTARLD